MVIEITRREVLNNLIRFKDSLLDRRDKQEKKGKRSYRVLLNRRTGDMRFAQKITALEAHISRKAKTHGSAEDWKEVQILVEKTGSGVHFEVCDESQHPLKPTQLEPLAWRIAQETISVLNQKVQESAPSELLPEEAALQDLSSIHLAPPKERIEELLGWRGPLSRLAAEKLLKKSPAGTYLLRNADPLLSWCARHLSLSNGFAVRAYLMTVAEAGGKIADILLLDTEKGWTLFLDDPNLRDRAYRFHPSPGSLVHTLAHFAKNPLI